MSFFLVLAGCLGAADEPTLLDERVSSHEIGHILGLVHARSDPSRLMFIVAAATLIAACGSADSGAEDVSSSEAAGAT